MRVDLPLLDQVGEVVGEYQLPRGYVLAPTYLQAVIIVALLFLLVLALGQLRRRIIGWQLGGVVPGVVLGFVLVLILEGIFIIGGRTILTELVGWEKAPKPLVEALDAGRNRLVDVLGVTDEVPVSTAAEKASVEKIMSEYVELSSSEQENLKEAICSSEEE